MPPPCISVPTGDVMPSFVEGVLRPLERPDPRDPGELRLRDPPLREPLLLFRDPPPRALLRLLLERLRDPLRPLLLREPDDERLLDLRDPPRELLLREPLRERLLDPRRPPREVSPASDRSLFTVRAAISSARSLLMPRRRPESLMCSYCLPRLLPLLTPRGGIRLLRELGSQSRVWQAISRPNIDDQPRARVLRTARAPRVSIRIVPSAAA